MCITSFRQKETYYKKEKKINGKLDQTQRQN